MHCQHLKIMEVERVTERITSDFDAGKPWSLIERDKPYSRVYRRLEEYETAEEEGRLVWLPCKIGDVLYLPIDFQNRIYTGKCVGFEYSRMRRKWVVKVFTSEERNSYEAFEHFGKTFFLTREEAEKHWRK